MAAHEPVAAGHGNMAVGLGNVAAGLGNVAAGLGNVAVALASGAAGLGNVAAGLENVAVSHGMVIGCMTVAWEIGHTAVWEVGSMADVMAAVSLCGLTVSSWLDILQLACVQNKHTSMQV